MSAASFETIENFKTKFNEMVKKLELSRDQVYNADETGLNYKALPNKTLAGVTEKYAPGFKMQKQRITLMVCANASGNHRLPLLAVHTAKKPRCFKGLNMDTLPVNYYNQKSAWMNQEIFRDWFHKVFVPSVRDDLLKKNLPPKAVLVLDNAPSHPSQEDALESEDGLIKKFFLPPNSTALIQPMDQSVIENLKRRYRKKFLQNLISEAETTLKEYWKQYDMKQAIENAADAWSDISAESLKRSWNKLWPDDEAIETTESLLLSLSVDILGEFQGLNLPGS